MSTLEIHNPATGKIIGQIPADSLESLQIKFKKTTLAQDLWKKVPMDERVACALRFKELLISELETLALDLTRETGKPVSQSRAEIQATPSRIDYFVEMAPKLLACEVVSQKGAAVTEMIEHEPLGVIANISAWNYPYFVGLNVIIPALLAGNGVIYKPSEYSALSGLHIVRLLVEAGFPKDLIVSAIGHGPVGEAVLDLPINGIFFTGSSATGQKILSRVGSRMMRVQLELGGKDGIYVCDDADLSFAVPSIAEGAFYNAGQGCCSVERIFVHQKIYERFKEALVKEVASYVIGDPTHNNTFIGPLTRPQHLGFLEDQIREATQNNESVIWGGKRLDREGAYFAPTIVECKGNTCRVMREESFGPIVAIQSVANDQEAIEKLNDTPYGLTAGVYTLSKERAVAILKDAKVGTAYVNCCDKVSALLPWSGRKASGIGATLSTEGIRCFAQSKAWFFRAV